jgi:hypothetical protein
MTLCFRERVNHGGRAVYFMNRRAGTVGGMTGGRGVTPASLQEPGSGAGPAFIVKAADCLLDHGNRLHRGVG